MKNVSAYPLCAGPFLVIIIIVTSFQLFDGSFAPEASIGRLCGEKMPMSIVSSNVLFVEFKSDGYVSVGRGFEASYQHVQGIH